MIHLLQENVWTPLTTVLKWSITTTRPITTKHVHNCMQNICIEMQGSNKILMHPI